MNSLKRRLEKLELNHKPVSESLSNLSDEELDDAIVDQLESNKMLPSKLHLRLVIKSRRLVNDPSWTRDENHRISAFGGFIKTAIDQKLPEEIQAVFGLGWRNVEIPESDIELILKTLPDADLGDEWPWVEGYMKNSGIISEYYPHHDLDKCEDA